MTAAAELADLRQRLAAYAVELRAEADLCIRWRENGEAKTLRVIADEIEARFAQGAIDCIAEPVFAFGEREE